MGTLLAAREHLERLPVGSVARLCLDAGHLAVAGIGPLELVELAPQRVRRVRPKDVDARLAQAVGARRCGYWEAVLKGLSVPPEDDLTWPGS